MDLHDLATPTYHYYHTARYDYYRQAYVRTGEAYTLRRMLREVKYSSDQEELDWSLADNWNDQIFTR